MDSQSETTRRRRRPPQPAAVEEAQAFTVETEQDAPKTEVRTEREPEWTKRKGPEPEEWMDDAPVEEFEEHVRKTKPFKRSKVEFLAASLGLLYAVYLIHYFYGAWMSDDFSGWIAARLATPHIVCAALGAALSFAAFLSNVRWLALAGAVLYCAAAAVFPVYAELMIPLIVLSAWGCVIIWRHTGKSQK